MEIVSHPLIIQKDGCLLSFAATLWASTPSLAFLRPYHYHYYSHYHYSSYIVVILSHLDAYQKPKGCKVLAIFVVDGLNFAQLRVPSML